MPQERPTAEESRQLDKLPPAERAQAIADRRAERNSREPENMTNVWEAQRLTEATGEDRPGVIADRAQRLHTSIVPTYPDGFDALAGRISLTVDEAAPALGLSPRTVRNAIKNGEIPSVKVGGRRLIPVKALERHLEALAYAETGALDAWELALGKAVSVRLQRSRRKAYAARRELKRRMAKLRERAATMQEGGPGETREEAERIVAELVAARAQLTQEERLAGGAGEALLGDIDAIKDEYGLD